MPLGKHVIPVRITDKMLDKIKYLCKCIPREEWSGVLFYTVNGTIKEPENFEIILEDVFPMDKGNATYTSYELDEILIGYRMDNPETLQMQIGHIHSHNVMNVFFSGVDDGELTDNAQHYNYYVSVVVNNYLDFAIKVVFAAESVAYNMKDEDGNVFQIGLEKPSIDHFYYNGRVDLKEVFVQVDDDFAARVKTVITESEKKKSFHKNNGQGGQGKNGTQKSLPFNQGKTKMKPYYKNEAGTEDENFNFKQYEAVMDMFLLDLLEQNTPIVIVNKNLDSALSVLTLNVKRPEYNEYVSSTIADFPEVYDLYFEESPNMIEEFRGDLDYVIERFENCKYKNHALVKELISGFNKFKDEFETSLMGT